MVFLLSPVIGCVSLKIWKSQDKAVEVTVNSKEENSEDFCLDFIQEFGLLILVISSTSCQLQMQRQLTVACSWTFLLKPF